MENSSHLHSAMKAIPNSITHPYSLTRKIYEAIRKSEEKKLKELQDIQSTTKWQQSESEDSLKDGEKSTERA